MKGRDYIFLLVIGALSALLIVQKCRKDAPPVVQVQYFPINLDSLKRTIPKDTVITPGPERQIVRYVTLTVIDERTKDSLVSRYLDLEKRYADLASKLRSDWGDGLGVDLETEEHVYADSIQTKDYFYRWYISAEGPIKSHSYGILPIFPPPPPAVIPPAKKLHRAGAYFGGQTAPGGLRTVFAGKYGYGPLNIQGGYLPPSQGQPAAGQLLFGIEIPFR